MLRVFANRSTFQRWAPLGLLSLLFLDSLVHAEPKRKLADLFEKYDKNKDGRVTPDELPMPKLFKRLDTNGDGAITKEELGEKTTADAEDTPLAKPTAPEVEPADTIRLNTLKFSSNFV